MPNPFGLSLACPEPVEGSKPCLRAARPFLRYLRTIGIQAQGERLNEEYGVLPRQPCGQPFSDGQQPRMTDLTDAANEAGTVEHG